MSLFLCSGAAGMSTQQARMTLNHDAKGKQARVYEDANPTETVKGVVQLMRNCATTYEPPKPAPIFEWHTVTDLSGGGALGGPNLPPWKRAMHLANHVVNDASGVLYPRKGTLREKIDYTYKFYPDVSLRVQLSLIPRSPINPPYHAPAAPGQPSTSSANCIACRRRLGSIAAPDARGLRAWRGAPRRVRRCGLRGIGS
jgi:hypothetical protein